MRFIFTRSTVAIWNFPFLRIFLNRISTAGADRRMGQYHTDALVYNAPVLNICYRSAVVDIR